MSEAKVRQAMQAAQMPDERQIAQIETKAAQFADALHAEGMALDAPDKRFAVRFLVMRAATKVFARIARREDVAPRIEFARSTRWFEQMLTAALEDEAAYAARLLAMQTHGPLQ